MSYSDFGMTRSGTEPRTSYLRGKRCIIKQPFLCGIQFKIEIFFFCSRRNCICCFVWNIFLKNNFKFAESVMQTLNLCSRADNRCTFMPFICMFYYQEMIRLSLTARLSVTFKPFPCAHTRTNRTRIATFYGMYYVSPITWGDVFS